MNLKIRRNRSLSNHLGTHHCVKSVRIQSYSGTYFPAFGMNTERYGVFSPNAGKYGPE